MFTCLFFFNYFKDGICFVLVYHMSDEKSMVMFIVNPLCIMCLFHPLAVFKLLFLLLFSGKVAIISHTFFMLIRLGTMCFSGFWIQNFPHIWNFSAINFKNTFPNVSSSKTRLIILILFTGYWIFVHFFNFFISCFGLDVSYWYASDSLTLSSVASNLMLNFIN